MANEMDERKNAHLEGEFVNLDVQVLLFIVLTIPHDNWCLYANESHVISTVSQHY